jgi:glycosyltransferase involved in cell wall biosynthesis
LNDYLPWTIKRLDSISKNELDLLLQPKINVVQDQSEIITNLMALLYEKQHGCIPTLATFRQRHLLLQWYYDKAWSIYNLDGFFKLISDKTYVQNEAMKGFNLVGYSRGQLGLGEDLRAYAALLKSKHIPFSIFHIGHPSDDPVIHTVKEESDALLFSHSLFFMNMIELKKLFDIYSEEDKSFGYRIAIPPWELPKAPQAWLQDFSRVDEVWAMSDFVLRAYEDVVPNVTKASPVVLRPIAQVNPVKRQLRPFTFLYIFDAGSYLQRKNPLAVLQAFLQAFHQGRENVRLILKTTRKLSEYNLGKQLIHLAHTDSRVHLITNLATENQINDLWNQCDCYVSLHRSEGFGRTIAEAVSRRIPVITTNWSGNMDITGEDYPLGVDYSLIDIQDDEYPYGEGQQWADPVISDAVAKIRWVYDNYETIEIEKIVEQNMRRFDSYFSIDAGNRPIENVLVL